MEAEKEEEKKERKEDKNSKRVKFDIDDDNEDDWQTAEIKKLQSKLNELERENGK